MTSSPNRVLVHLAIINTTEFGSLGRTFGCAVEMSIGAAKLTDKLAALYAANGFSLLPCDIFTMLRRAAHHLLRLDNIMAPADALPIQATRDP